MCLGPGRRASDARRDDAGGRAVRSARRSGTGGSTMDHVAMQPDTTPAGADADDLRELDRYWRAANYLSVGQIYLLDNPLLREPLKPEHVKPRLLGHWGTTPGLNFIYAHLNRVIRRRDL